MTEAFEGMGDRFADEVLQMEHWVKSARLPNEDRQKLVDWEAMFETYLRALRVRGAFALVRGWGRVCGLGLCLRP